MLVVELAGEDAATPRAMAGLVRKRLFRFSLIIYLGLQPSRLNFNIFLFDFVRAGIKKFLRLFIKNP